MKRSGQTERSVPHAAVVFAGADVARACVSVVGSQLQDASLRAPERRLIDYEWQTNEDVGPVFWATVNRFCAECAEFDCPVLLAIQAASGNRHLRLNAIEAAVQTRCSFTKEFHEADGVVAARRRRVA